MSDLREKILSNNPTIPPEAVDHALHFLDNAKVTNKKHMAIVDFSLSDAKDRFHFIDLATGLAEHFKVAHGKNSDQNKDNIADHFSNVEGSYQSSLGAMVIGTGFSNPKWKVSHLMDGLEPGLNDHVRARQILWHSTKYVDDSTASASGDTLGCFGMSEAAAIHLHPLVQGCLLYAWHPQLEGQVVPGKPKPADPKPVPPPTSTHDMHAAVEIIKEFEGFFAKAYKDPVGIWTIGWGTIVYPGGKKVQSGDVCTQAQAAEWLLFEMQEKASGVSHLVKVPLNDNEFCALTSFAYNCGVGAFQSSTLLRKLNAGAPKLDVANELLRWVNAGGHPLAGLVRRRKAEKALFLA